jgi:hypothetical protein
MFVAARVHMQVLNEVIYISVGIEDRHLKGDAIGDWHRHGGVLGPCQEIV